MNVVGTSAKRIDGIEKATGTAQFTVDIELPRLIHAKVKRSPVPHAEIVRIDTSQAKELPGVRAVVTGAEIPDVRMGVLTLDEHLLARDRVRFVGEPVASVAADTPEIARAACELIEVEYRELPALFDPEEAIKLDPPVVLHEDYDEYEKLLELAEMEERPPNLWQAYRIRYGDIDEIFEKAVDGGGFIVENRYATGYVHTACMEPHAAVAQWSADDTLTVWASGLIALYRARCPGASSPASGQTRSELRRRTLRHFGPHVFYFLFERCGEQRRSAPGAQNQIDFLGWGL